MARFALSETRHFDFLAWNLVLAWIPLFIAMALPRLAGRRWLVAGPLLVAWLVFLPNAPYLVTDLVHLRDRPWGSPWLDFVMIPAFALTGLLIGAISLTRVRRAVRAAFDDRTAGAAVAAAIVLAGVGMYVGRVLQWNSWDVVTEPGTLLRSLGAHLAEPRTLAIAVTLIAACAACVAVAYGVVRTRVDRG